MDSNEAMEIIYPNNNNNNKNNKKKSQKGTDGLCVR